jgi:hypothetical protein
MAKIQLELKSGDPEVESLIARIDSDSITIARPDHFEGGIGIVNVLVNITALTIAMLTHLITQHSKSKRYIKVKVGGVEIHGENSCSNRGISQQDKVVR